MRVKCMLIVLVFISNLFLLTSCKSEDRHFDTHGLSKIKSGKNTKTNPPTSFFNEYQLPIMMSGMEFNRALGWLNDDEIIYLTNGQKGNSLYRHDLRNGLSHPLFESEFPILSVLISPDKKNILIHSSPTTYEGMVTIINDRGKTLVTETFPSVEIEFEWNRYYPNHILITTFKEDWSFTNYLLDLKQKGVQSIDIRKPFAKWTGKNTLAFLDWNDNDISLLAPLVQKEINKNEVMLEEDIYFFDSFLDKMLLIKVNQAKEAAYFQFYSNQLKQQNSFQVPVLTNYSGWLIPYYELTANQNTFLAMVPYKSGAADQNSDGFQLVSFDLKSNEKEIILNQSENIPFVCAPKGQNCLYGYQFEQLLNTKSKTLLPLFNVNK